MLATAQNAPLLRGYMVLGATDQDYINKDVAPSPFASRDAWLKTAADSVAAEQITSTGNPSCSAQSYSGPPMALKALQTGGLALTMAAGAGVASQGGIFGTGALAASGAASTAFAAATFGVGAAVAIFSIIHAHHAAAVSREHSLECSLIPPANYALQLIDQAVAGGQMTPAVASKSLDKLYSDFVSAATGGPGGLQDSGGKCNAMCVFAHILKAIIDKKKDKYVAMAAAPAVSSSGPTVAAPVSSGSVMVLPTSTTPAAQAAAAAASSPSWLPIAAVIIGGFLLMKVF